MTLSRPKAALLLLIFLLLCSRASAQALTITSVSPASGAIGTQVVIDGTGFGTTQGTSTLSLNGTGASIMGWTDTSIVAVVPGGSSSGPFTITIGTQTANSASFTVLPLPSGWSDSDVGSVGVAGTATYAGGTFTVKGSGTWIYGNADAMHFAYQSLSGDGTIIARLASLTGTGAQVGVMVRETLGAGSANAFLASYYSGAYLFYRSSTGGSTSQQSGSTATPPCWLKAVRSGNTFATYQSGDGLNWTQIGTNQTITMATDVYIGLAVSSDNNSSLATATFDNVSINSSAASAPVISGISATTGAVGSQVTISGSGFGDSGMVLLNGALVPLNSWSSTSVTITIPSGATSGYLVVSAAPTMNDSNPIGFSVTSQPLPSSWLDLDIGAVGSPGSATFAGGTFTLNGSGSGITATSDQMHFAYQTLSGDGSIVARIVSNSSGAQSGVMIRETLSPGSTEGLTAYYSSYTYLFDRPTTGGSTSQQANYIVASLPYWLKLTRSGTTFTGYQSADGQNWTQVGTSQTITMATNVFIGLAVSSVNNSSTATATFDNVSINSSASPAPVITSASATTGLIGSQVVISGTGFGASQNGSSVLLNDVSQTINFWSDTSITFTIPSGVTSGPLVVSVAPSMNDSNPIDFTVTTQPLPTPWLDDDVGPVGQDGSATYSSGTFTVKGSGAGITSTADQMHFVYQPLSGDGTLVARIVSNSSSAQSGVMIRETLDADSTEALTANYPSYTYLFDRSTTGGSTSQQANYVTATLPYWLKIVRSGSTFTGYQSTDGTTWIQVGTSQSISMATTVYVGLAVSSVSNSSLATATFDNVSLTPGLAPLITGVSPTIGTAGTSVTVSGVSFGATQGTSTITFHGLAPASITSWSDPQIVATLPSSIPTGPGPVVVTVGSTQSNSNVQFTAINPVISTLSPPAADVGGHVTIVGSGFGTSQGSSTVLFNGTSAGTAPAWTDTSITVVVPSGATNGSVTVTEQGYTSNGVTFTVIGQPSVSAISPTSGPVGTSVTITGTNFGSTQSDSTVSVGGVNASIVSWTTTSIVASVASGSSSGLVTVQVAGIAAYGPTFTVDASVRLTDSLGHTSTYTSVIAGGEWYNLNSTGPGCSSCSIRGATNNTYDGYGNVITSTDPLGYVTSYGYDANNNLASVAQPAVGGTNPTTSYTYNMFGEVLTMTDPLGHVTTNTYDSHGNLTSVTTPSPGGGASASVTSFTYNSLGEIVQITDPLSHVTTITYTTAGQVATITDPQSHVTTYAYDSRGNRTSITDALSHVTTFSYDSMNRLTMITYPDSTTTTYTYDARGRQTSVIDQNGKTTTYTYDDADRVTSVTDAASNVTQYAYDTESNLTGITDANSHTTSFNYDALRRVTQTTFPLSLSESYTYDDDNNLTSKTDRKSQTIQYVYDALSRLTQKNYPDSTSVEYTYDLVGKITQVSDPTGTYGFSYDNMNRLTGTTTQYSFLSGTFTNSYSYDADSNRIGYTAPDSSTNTYTYDSLNRLTNLTNSWAGSFGLSYDALSRRTQMTRPNGIATNYSYDNLSHLLSVLHQLSSSTIDGASYTVDSAGNRTAKTDQLASATTNYGYDSIYQLLSATQGGTTTESYTYDPVGNRLSSVGVSSYTTNSSNELTADSNASFSYDNNGNTTSKTVSAGTTNYSWDFENRMTSVTLPASGGTVSFKYDPFGKRIEKISPTTTSIFAYDGDDLIETVNSSGSTVARYTQGPNIDEPLAMQRGTTTDYYEQDGIGSVTSLSGSTGTIAQSYTYDSFGATTNSSGSLTNFFRYTAREFDTETNLLYDRARYYDPGTGRFVSEDPIGFVEGPNFYDYVHGNPVGLSDPSGLWGTGVTLGGTAEGGIINGGALNGSVGAGVFFNGLKPSVGAFASGGAFIGGPGLGKAAPSCPSQNPFVIGGFAGGGINMFATNANNVKDLAGPFKNYSFNIGIGMRVVSVQLAVGQNGAGKPIGVLSFSGGPLGGAGLGLDISGYNTNTTTTAGKADCGCQK